jgi:hypothetical protein
VKRMGHLLFCFILKTVFFFQTQACALAPPRSKTKTRMNGESDNPIAEKQGLFSGRLNFKNDDITTVLAVGGAAVAIVGSMSRVLDEKLSDNNKELTREFRDNNKELTREFATFSREITAATASSAQTTLLKCSVVALSGVILAPFLVLLYTNVLLYQKGQPPPDASRR